MADNIGNKAAHDYHLDVPVAQEGFYVRGAANCDFGMKSRLARMFNPKSGNAVMLAFDHGYIMGPTAGLERIDLVIPPLIPYVDVLMGTRGVILHLSRPAGGPLRAGNLRLHRPLRRHVQRRRHRLRH